MDFAEFTGRVEVLFSLKGITRNQPSGVYDRLWDVVAQGSTAEQIEECFLHLEENLDRRDILGSFRKARGLRFTAAAASTQVCQICAGNRVLPRVRVEGVDQKAPTYNSVLEPCLCVGGELALEWREAYFSQRLEGESFASWYEKVIPAWLNTLPEGRIGIPLQFLLSSGVMEERMDGVWGDYWFDEILKVTPTVVEKANRIYQSLLNGKTVRFDPVGV